MLDVVACIQKHRAEMMRPQPPPPADDDVEVIAVDFDDEIILSEADITMIDP